MLARRMAKRRKLTSVEFCAGAGGQALGLERAGFAHRLLVDNDVHCCETLKLNRPRWKVQCEDMKVYQAPDVGPVDLFAAGLPCPPFSIAGKQLGPDDDRDLFPAAFRLIEAFDPSAVLIENVRGFLAKSFTPYRDRIVRSFNALGYDVDWRLYNAKDFGVPQTRSRVAIVAAKHAVWPHFTFPDPVATDEAHVGDVLQDLMAAEGWTGAETWARLARGAGPTIVGGSKKHGGPDLGPTRARATWKTLGVNGSSIAETAPDKDFAGHPRLTTRMVARLQGFPDDWVFSGRKTAAYRQVGNAFPPPVAFAVGRAIKSAILASEAAQELEKQVAAE